MLPPSNLNITSFSEWARVTRTGQMYGKTKVIEVNISIAIAITLFMNIALRYIDCIKSDIHACAKNCWEIFYQPRGDFIERSEKHLLATTIAFDISEYLNRNFRSCLLHGWNSSPYFERVKLTQLKDRSSSRFQNSTAIPTMSIALKYL